MEKGIALERIISHLDELTADLLIEENITEARDRWHQSLVQLAELASASQNHRAAEIAKTAATVLKDDSVAGSELAKSVECRLAEIRDALTTPSVPAQAPTPIAIADDPELIADFVLEAREHLENIEAQILGLEQDACNTEALHSIFRSFHTIKGLAGFLELHLIQEVAHEVETVLDKARQGEFRLNAAAFDVILESRDYIGAWLKFLSSGDRSAPPQPLQSNHALVARIAALLAGSSGAAAPNDVPTEAVSETRQLQSMRETSRLVKVDTAKLDYLVDMVGEMVIAQSMVRHDPMIANAQSSTLARNLGQLARITDEVQRTAMSMRMVPVGPLFQKMARLVRDLSRKVGKRIQFESEGEEVELDRNIVEELADPLMHMVRNAVDHGIEAPAERSAAGKPETATISLRAFHRSGQIVIQVADDGKGIDREKVLAKARAKGLIAPNVTPTDAECLNLIFQPGFSTAEQVSDVSGRGVGMDVVRKQVSKLRGNVDIESKVGEGTTFSLRLPLTLAIIDGLVVAVGKERYIIPLASVREMLRPTADLVSSVENRAEVVVIRNQLLPLVRLYERFHTTPRSTDPTECVLVVADLDGCSFCLMVDELVGKQEVVIKSLGPMFASTTGVAGGAILGDGQVGLILDLQSLFGGRADA